VREMTLVTLPGLLTPEGLVRLRTVLLFLPPVKVFFHGHGGCSDCRIHVDPDWLIPGRSGISFSLSLFFT